MGMKNFVRGAGVHISVTFKDNAGNVVQPTGANVTISYVQAPQGSQGRTFQTYALAKNLTSGAVDWIYDWDSSVSEPCQVDCHAVTTTGGVPVSSVDFSFRLTANRANRELAGDDVPNDFYR